MRNFKIIVPLAGVLALLIFLQSRNAKAIPAFARKYETSCQTCHTAFPMLNPFGEAFKHNGFRFPGEAEAEAVKDTPVPLGSEGYKKTFPNSVWPGEIPGNIPLAIMIDSNYAYTAPDHKNGILENHDFSGLGTSFELISAGTLGSRISFWGGAAFTDGEVVEVARGYVQFNFFSTPAMNLKVGSFEPGLSEVSGHRSVWEDYWFLQRTVGDNGWSPEPHQLGFELNGVLGGRFGYNAGLVEGQGNQQNRDKDFYGRAEVKLGGMRLDGVSEGDKGESTAAPKPWTDNSVTISAFYYQGTALLAGDSMQKDNFHRYGADLQGSLGNFLYKGGYMAQHNQQPVLATPGRHVDSADWFVETSYVVFPWLIPSVRYEDYVSQLQHQPDQRLMFGVVALIRANVRVNAVCFMGSVDGGPFRIDGVNAGVTVVF